ncbi:MAG: hypothetical protein AAF363_22310 [Bacteroidota bacterium]
MDSLKDTHNHIRSIYGDSIGILSQKDSLLDEVRSPLRTFSDYSGSLQKYALDTVQSIIQTPQKFIDQSKDSLLLITNKVNNKVSSGMDSLINKLPKSKNTLPEAKMIEKKLDRLNAGKTLPGLDGNNEEILLPSTPGNSTISPNENTILFEDNEFQNVLSIDENISNIGISEDIDKYSNQLEELDSKEKLEGKAENELNDKVSEYIETEGSMDNSMPVKDYQAILNGYQSKGIDAKSQTKEGIQRKIKGITDKFEDKDLSRYQKRLNEANSKLKKYKKKHDIVKQENGQKIRSSESKSLRERLFWGMNFEVHRGDPVGIDFSPQVSYQISRKLFLGSGITYQLSFTTSDESFISNENETYGYRVFSNYLLFKGLSGYVEFESMQRGGLGNALKESWQGSFLIGLQKKINVSGRLSANVQGLYNILHNGQNIHQSPFVFRFGLEIRPKSKALRRTKNEP